MRNFRSARPGWWLASLLLLTAAGQAAAQDDFHGCGMAGTAKPAAIKAVNQLKNRYTAPADGDVDSGVSLKKMLKVGDDTDRFDEERAADIVGYVYDVKPGGKETCNCGATDPEFRDTHIELVPSPTLNDPTHRVIVARRQRLAHESGRKDDLAGDGVGGPSNHDPGTCPSAALIRLTTRAPN